MSWWNRLCGKSGLTPAHDAAPAKATDPPGKSAVQAIPQPVVDSLQSIVKVINESVTIAAETKSEDTRRSRLWVARENLATLQSLAAEWPEVHLTNLAAVERNIADIEALPPLPTRARTRRGEAPVEFAGALEGFRIVAALDCGTCLKCSALDGRCFAAEIGPRPPFHKNCRCIAVPVARSWKSMGIDVPEISVGTRASAIGQVPADWNHLRWLLTTQPRWRIYECLGETYAHLLLKSEMDPQVFTDLLLTPRYRVRTMRELAALAPDAFMKAGLTAYL
jgi:hypothetical protein